MTTRHDEARHELAIDLRNAQRMAELWAQRSKNGEVLVGTLRNAREHFEGLLSHAAIGQAVDRLREADRELQDVLSDSTRWAQSSRGEDIATSLDYAQARVQDALRLLGGVR